MRLELARTPASARRRTSSAAARRATGRRRARRRASRPSARPAPRRRRRTRGTWRCRRAVFEIEVDARVHAALAEVAVERRTRSRSASSSARNSRRYSPSLLGRHRRVLPAFPGVGLIGHVRGRAEPGLAHLPDALRSRIVEQLHRRRALRRAAARPSAAAPCASASSCVSPPNSTSSQPLPGGQQLDVAPGAGACASCRRPARSSMPSSADRLGSQHLADVVAGLVHVRVAEHEQRRGAAGSARAAPSPRGSLTSVPSRADQRARDVEAVLRQQRGQVVAGDAARNVGEAARGSRPRSGRAARAGRGRCRRARPPAARMRVDSSLVAGRADAHARAVVGQHVELDHVVARCSPPIIECTPHELLPIMPPSV